ncbi:hypothetical protein WN51_01832 [Melipona quadrifasciata]|uniref:Uncharacterized protein n=1 Tax=Melipona quadrifasciata TaxID=166423 RepID=A0A0M8ZZB1_9HYME|nr:hypothetical protein WN51_01832 [Melipona quadrifasciata]
MSPVCYLCLDALCQVCRCSSANLKVYSSWVMRMVVSENLMVKGAKCILRYSTSRMVQFIVDETILEILNIISSTMYYDNLPLFSIDTVELLTTTTTWIKLVNFLYSINELVLIQTLNITANCGSRQLKQNNSSKFPTKYSSFRKLKHPETTLIEPKIGTQVTYLEHLESQDTLYFPKHRSVRLELNTLETVDFPCHNFLSSDTDTFFTSNLSIQLQRLLSSSKDLNANSPSLKSIREQITFTDLEMCRLCFLFDWLDLGFSLCLFETELNTSSLLVFSLPQIFIVNKMISSHPNYRVTALRSSLEINSFKEEFTSIQVTVQFLEIFQNCRVQAKDIIARKYQANPSKDPFIVTKEKRNGTSCDAIVFMTVFYARHV